jgi:hypothetical protein
VNQYFNEKLHPFLANTDAPTGWIVHFELNRAAA